MNRFIFRCIQVNPSMLRGTLSVILCLVSVAARGDNLGTDSSAAPTESYEAVVMDGTASIGGESQFGSFPFSAVLRGRDTMALTLTGPFGITAARIVITGDSFFVVNYLLREVHTGWIGSNNLSQILPIPVSLGDLITVFLGSPPDRAEGWVREQRQDGSALLTRKTPIGAEFAHLDTSNGFLRQYQRKSSNGDTELNIVFQDRKLLDTVAVPGKVHVSMDNQRQVVSVTINDAAIKNVNAKAISLEAPSGFRRYTYQ